MPFGCRTLLGSWRRSIPALTISVVLITADAAPAGVGSATDSSVVAAEQRRVQDVVDGLRSRLELGHDVQVTLVPWNPLLVSVERLRERDGFQLCFERGFLDSLSDHELEAVVAHELGHVWIFTHHPYLQTEALANQIALRVVPRDSLETVYEKVWARGGHKGNLVRFIGNEGASPARAARQPGPR
jgi:Peptidase family M48